MAGGDYYMPESRAESLRKQKLKQDYLDRIVPVLKKLEDEGFRKGGKTHIPTKGDVPTIGYGHTGKYAEANATMTEPFASDLLRSETGERLRVLKRQIPDLYEYDPVTQTALGASQYRGSLGQSPKARRLLNEGKGEASGEEFLNSEEYRNAVARGRAGIRPRMEQTSRALRGSHKPGSFTGSNHLMFMK
jgi:GH24 family phage-related lysozyme (muramidase)